MVAGLTLSLNKRPRDLSVHKRNPRQMLAIHLIIFLREFVETNYLQVIWGLYHIVTAFLSVPSISNRKSRSQMFFEIGLLKNLANFTGKHLCWSLCNFIKKRLQHRCFSVKFVKFPRIPFFREHFWWLLLFQAGFILNFVTLVAFLDMTKMSCAMVRNSNSNFFSVFHEYSVNLYKNFS